MTKEPLSALKRPRTSVLPTSSPPKVTSFLTVSHAQILTLYLFAAVADVVRTSLGPRGMDKMVSLESSISAHSVALVFENRHPQRLLPNFFFLL